MYRQIESRMEVFIEDEEAAERCAESAPKTVLRKVFRCERHRDDLGGAAKECHVHDPNHIDSTPGGAGDGLSSFLYPYKISTLTKFLRRGQFFEPPEGFNALRRNVLLLQGARRSGSLWFFSEGFKASRLKTSLWRP